MNDDTFEIISIHKVSKFSYFFRYNEVVIQYKASSKDRFLVFAINKEDCLKLLNKEIMSGILFLAKPGCDINIQAPPIKFVELMIRNIEKYEKLQEYR